VYAFDIARTSSSVAKHVLVILLTAALIAMGSSYAKDPDSEETSIAKRRNYWAFQKPVRPPAPSLQSPWIKSPTDAFLLEAMRARSLSPSRAVNRRQLIRRVTLDLTGLPPTPKQVQTFLTDPSATAYEKLVDRLFASPQYGERWALRWLDVARYADTNGFEVDALRPNAWRYRDYVVKAFNEDKPYDRFVREQIAGDELWPRSQEALIATGFNRLGPIHIVSGVQDEELNRQERLTEMAGAIGPIFLGLTVGCARCHNHKFDPILQSDYYRLQAIFASTEFKEKVIASEAEKAAYENAKKAFDARLKPLQDQIAALEKHFREQLRAAKVAKLEPALQQVLAVPEPHRNPEQKKLAKDAEAQVEIRWDELLGALPASVKSERAVLRRQLLEIQRREPEAPAEAYAVADMEGSPPDTHILKVGDYRARLGVVQPGFLKVLAMQSDVPQTSAGRRAALANWLASTDHPLTARVMVNRIWQLRMGTGIVATPNDFGVLGQRPSNQKLLDWLAAEFMARNWSIKTIDRLIVLSSAYQQESGNDDAKARIDPENKLYWRANKRRLEGEIIRDEVLAAAGTLNPRMGGKPVLVPIEKEVYDLIFTEAEPDNLWPVTPDPGEHTRRSLYLLNKRSVRLPLVANFDQPDTMTSCPVRSTSTHSLQSLSLFNSDFMQEQSHAFAGRLVRDAGQNRRRQIRRAFELALSREPRPRELALARKFLAKAPLSALCLTLFNRNEFVYVP
jgi:Protein of unknown function (DUF1549)/Protein of unknown function (DUF1553)